jgi:hypothetical protein
MEHQNKIDGTDQMENLLGIEITTTQEITNSLMIMFGIMVKEDLPENQIQMSHIKINIRQLIVGLVLYVQWELPIYCIEQ